MSGDDQAAEPTWHATEPDGETTQFDRQAAEQAIAEARVPVGEEQEEHGEPPMRFVDPDSGEVFQTHRAAEPPSTNPITDTGSTWLPPVNVDEAEICTHCGGRVPTDHELLVQVRELIAPVGPQAMHLFYERLFTYAPDLRNLFPARIEVQEEKLLSAIVALLTLFQAGEREMGQLDAELAKFGRSHTRFDPSATIEEYATVWRALSEVIAENFGDKLTERHVNVIRRAYEYAAGRMLVAQAVARLRGPGRRRRNT